MLTCAVWFRLFVWQGSKTPKFTRGFVLFLAFALCKLGVEATSSSMDAVQPKIMLMILQQVRVLHGEAAGFCILQACFGGWCPSLPSVASKNGMSLEFLAVAALATLTDPVSLRAPVLPLLLLLQVWVPNLSLAGPDPDEEKLVTVAATKCLTECGDVYSSRPLWDQLRAALEDKLKGGTSHAFSSGGTAHICAMKQKPAAAFAIGHRCWCDTDCEHPKQGRSGAACWCIPLERSICVSSPWP